MATTLPGSSTGPKLKRRAVIRTYDGAWFRFTVHRLDGIGSPEGPSSHHHTLGGARKAAVRWVESKPSQIIERVHGETSHTD